MGDARKALKSFRIPRGNKFGKYLGISTDFASSKNVIFNDLVEKVKKRISSWTGIFLSPAGRLTLIHSVLSTISSFFLSAFKIPISVASRIDSLLSHFWWAGLKKGRTIHWCSKKILWLPKKSGGLGIRRIATLNQALLAKTAWNLLMCPDNLLSRLLGGKYLKGMSFADFLEIRRSSTNVSWGWKGILMGFDLLRLALSWKIGRSSMVNIWNQKWVNGTIPIPMSGVTASNHLLMHNNIRQVQDLQIDGCCWNEQLIRDIFDEDWSNKILSIPISSDCGSYDIYWSKTVTGDYSVKSGYFLALQNHLADRMTETDESRIAAFHTTTSFSSILWRLPGPSKWKILLWKILTNTLPVITELNKRQIINDITCVLCTNGSVKENLSHLFRDYDFSSHIWKGCNLGINSGINTEVSFKGWIVNWVVYLYKKDKELSKGDENHWPCTTSFLAVLWSIWVSRNEAIFEASAPNPLSVIHMIKSVTKTVMESTKEKMDEQERMKFWGIFNQDDVSDTLAPGRTVVLSGREGSCSLIQIYVDAAWLHNYRAAAAWHCKHEDEFYGAADEGGISFWAENPLQAEARGVVEVVKWARARGLLHVQFLSDCLDLVRQLADCSAMKHCIWSQKDEIADFSCFFHCLVLSYIPRGDNRRAHHLANKVLKSAL